jgi:hypothetical protein
MRRLADRGGYWDARVTFGLRQAFGLEVAYLGAIHPVEAPGTGPGTALVGHGTEAALRVNVPIVRNPRFIAPYGLIGMGWMHYRIAGGSNDGTMLAGSDDIATIPLGVGVTMGQGHFYLDTRFVYRFTEYEDLVRSPDNDQGHLGQWTAGGSLGVVF